MDQSVQNVRLDLARARHVAVRAQSVLAGGQLNPASADNLEQVLVRKERGKETYALVDHVAQDVLDVALKDGEAQVAKGRARKARLEHA